MDYLKVLAFHNSHVINYKKAVEDNELTGKVNLERFEIEIKANQKAFDQTKKPY